jgi:hypothetical protein
MKNKVTVIPAVLLIISLGNYFMFFSDSSIRSVEFLSIFVIGALSGVLLTKIFKEIEDRKK